MPHTTLSHTISALALLMLVSSYSQARPSEDQIHYSPDHQIALLELYTSEGCSSCPPADRWLSRLHDVLIEEDNVVPNVVPLALHITYWNYIGWNDRYAHRRFDQRQRHIAQRAQSRNIYTPQFVLNGRDYRGLSDFIKDLRTIKQRPAKVRLGLALEDSGDPQSPIAWIFSRPVQASTTQSLAPKVSLYVAVFENALKSDIDSGENEGKQLKHDRVVRHLYGPLKAGHSDFSHALRLHIAPSWQRKHLGIALFAQDANTGEILQALQLNQSFTSPHQPTQ